MKRKFFSWDECMALREVRSLRKLTHPNIVKLREVIRDADELYFVFEFMERNLYEVMKGQRGKLSDTTVRGMMCVCGGARTIVPDVSDVRRGARVRALSACARGRGCTRKTT